MIVLRLDNVTFSHPGGLVLENLNWAIQAREKIGLVGPNGSGKTTLLKLLTGEVIPDSGAVFKSKGVTPGYLAQEITLSPEKTVLAEALTASPGLAEIERALAKIEATLADPAVYNDEAALTRTLEQQSRLLEQYQAAGGLSYENTVKAALRQVGLTDDDFELPVAALSGGQKKMLVLAKLAVNNPAVLLLDEPDNHLDLAGKNHLERFIRHYLEEALDQFNGAIFVISHDRYFLDKVIDQIVELDPERGTLVEYWGGYTDYLAAKNGSISPD